jgi:hypothetical protein
MKSLFDKHPMFSGNLWNWKEYLVILSGFAVAVSLAGIFNLSVQKNRKDYMHTAACIRFDETTTRTDKNGKVLHRESIGGYQCENGMLYWDNGHYTNWK